MCLRRPDLLLALILSTVAPAWSDPCHVVSMRIATPDSAIKGLALVFKIACDRESPDQSRIAFPLHQFFFYAYCQISHYILSILSLYCIVCFFIFVIITIIGNYWTNCFSSVHDFTMGSLPYVRSIPHVIK